MKLALVARSAAEIRADLALIERGVGIHGRLDQTTAAHRLLFADVPSLLAEVERLGRWIDGYKAEQEAIIARYMAEVERLRAQVWPGLLRDSIPVDDIRSALAASVPAPTPRREAATAASDMCPNCHGDNEDPWALCRNCLPAPTQETEHDERCERQNGREWCVCSNRAARRAAAPTPPTEEKP